MSAISKNLDRHFQSFIGNERPFAFFKGLAEYLEYMSSTLELKKVVDSNMAEREARYFAVLKLEQQVLTEAEAAKEKLLSVIKKKRIDTSTFKRLSPFTFPELQDPTKELEAYENKEIYKSGWRSDHILVYLFEIAVNIRLAGHENEIREFAASQNEYEHYHRRANGSEGYIVVGNEHGNFIFSQTWPERLLAEALIGTERELKLWGVFEAMLRFKSAYEAICKNGNPSTILQNVEDTVMAREDAVVVAFMAEDLRILMGHGQSTMRYRYSHTPDRIHDLDMDVFKTHAQMAHNHLMQVADATSSQNQPVGYRSLKSLAFKKNGEFYITKKSNDFYYKGDLRNLSKNPDWYKVFCALYDLIPEGGEIAYLKLGGQIKSKIKKSKNYDTKTMRKFIQTNLTDKSNGFMPHANIPENEDNGKPLLSVNRGKGIIFNNRIS